MVRGREGRRLCSCAGAVVMVVVVLLSVRHVAGQEACSLLASNLSACLPYVQVGNITRVGADCCNPLKSIVETRPDCVCTLQSLQSSIPKVNVTHALELSTLCNIISNATLSSCNGSSPTPPTTDRNGPPPPITDTNDAFSPHRSTFYIIWMGSALLVYILNQA